jgi:hypothetical protein
VAEESGRGEEAEEPGASAGGAADAVRAGLHGGRLRDPRLSLAARGGAAAGVDATRRERFVFLSTAADAVREIVPPTRPPEMLEEYRALFYHAYNFWSFGRRLYAVEPAVARYLVEARRAGGLDLRRAPPLALPPAPRQPLLGQHRHRRAAGAGGRLLRHRLLRARPARRPLRRRPGADGAGDPPAPRRLQRGPLRDRGGPRHPAALDRAGAGGGARLRERPPGGEIAGLYSILTTAEALKLVARLLWYVQDHAEQVTEAAAAERRSARSARDRCPSRGSRSTASSWRRGGSAEADPAEAGRGAGRDRHRSWRSSAATPSAPAPSRPPPARWRPPPPTSPPWPRRGGCAPSPGWGRGSPGCWRS